MQKSKIKNIKHFYRYLLYIFALLMKWSAQYLPRPFALWLGKLEGEVCFRILSRERNRTIYHLRMALGNGADAIKIAKDVFEHLGMNLVEWLQMPRMNRDKINRIVEAEGIDRINKALARGKGVIILIVIFGFVFLVLPFCSLCAQEMPVVTKTEEVKGFTMTIVDTGGKEKAAISGSVANILPGGLIEVLEVVARIYGQNMGGADTLVHTKKGIYNRSQNIITTDQFVRINRRDMVITGTGLEWLPDKSSLRINENVKVEYSYKSTEPPVVGGSSSLQGKTVVINSRGSAVMDYQKDLAVFKKGVIVEDQNAILKAHKMKFFFDDKTQNLTTVEAYGNVRIKQPKRESSSRKAVYYVNEDKIVLTGSPRIVQGIDLYTAEKVTIYDKGNRVVFQPKAQLIIYASTEHEKI